MRDFVRNPGLLCFESSGQGDEDLFSKPRKPVSGTPLKAIREAGASPAGKTALEILPRNGWGRVSASRGDAFFNNLGSAPLVLEKRPPSPCSKATRFLTKTAFFLSLAIFVGFSACGKKGPPFLPPQEPLDARVSALQGGWEGGYASLSGKVLGSQEARDRVKGCRVFYSRYSADNPPCDGCPIEYQGHYGFGRETVENGALLCRVPAKGEGQVYFFMVQLVGSNGTLGPPSNTVRVDVR